MIGLYLQNLRAEAPVLPPGNAVILNCEVREIGMRRGTGIDLFIHHVGAVSPGPFRYRTSILPIWLTKGETSVETKLRAVGNLFGYGGLRKYGTYQNKPNEAVPQTRRDV